MSFLKFLIFGILYGTTLISWAQSEQHLKALDSFQKYYNEKNAQALFDMMDERLQGQITFESVENIVRTFNDELGSFNSYSYVEKLGYLEIFEAEFDNARQNIAVSVNKNGRLNSLRFLPAEAEEKIAKIERNSTPLGLPFKGSWFTVWGGDTKAQNYHVISQTQKHAFDFLIIGKYNRTYERSGTRNEDYYAFGKPVFAVCDAEVFQVITGVEDNKPGEMNPAQALGNSVILKTKNEEYIVYAHFEKGTIKVKKGDLVKRGQFLGNCGNSGNSSEAHIHLHIQDGPDITNSVGVKCYFDEILVNGELKLDHSPVRFEVITPANE